MRRLVLAIAVVLALACVGGVAQARAASVALLFNDTYVDTSSSPFNAEAVNEEAAITDLGQQVTEFSDISAGGLATALAGKDFLVIPELEHGDLAPDLTPEALAVIRNFVAAGGQLVINGSSNRSSGVLNAVFGFSTATSGGNASTKQPAATGTEFDAGPTSLDRNSAITGLLLGSLPAGSVDAYNNGVGTSTVTIIPFGAGSITHLAWDWFESNPPDPAGRDGGWHTVLAEAFTKPSLSVDDAQVVEGNTGRQLLNFAVTLSQPVSEAVSVNFATANGSATAGSDYVATSGTLTFARGETVKTVTVPVNGDTAAELNETLSLVLSSPVAADIARGTATGTIVNDDAVVRDSVAPGVTLGKLPKTLGLAKLRKGVKVSETSSEPSSVQFALLGSARQVTLARAGDLTLASKTLRMGSGKRTVTLKPSRHLLQHPRSRFKVRLRVVATDAAGNAKTVTKTIKIKR